MLIIIIIIIITCRHHHYHHDYHMLASSIWFNLSYFSVNNPNTHWLRYPARPIFHRFNISFVWQLWQIWQVKICIFFANTSFIGLGKMFIMNLVLQVLRVSWNIIGDSSSGVAPIFLITILNDYHSHHFKWSPLQCIVIIITSCRDHHHHHILEWLIVVLRNILNSA